MKLPPVDQLEGSYLWPHTLRRAKPPPKLVYLDLNHWIALAKALVGHRDGRPHKGVLTACIRAVEGGSAIFPISDTIYFEVSKIGPYRQRRDLREVIERVSRYFVVTARSVISVHELEALLDHIVGPNPEPINAMDYLDWGVARASDDVPIEIKRVDATMHVARPRSSFVRKGEDVVRLILLDAIGGDVVTFNNAGRPKQEVSFPLPRSRCASHQ